MRLHTLPYRFTYGIATYQTTSQKRNIMKQRKGKNHKYFTAEQQCRAGTMAAQRQHGVGVESAA